MVIRFTCPDCKATYTADPRDAGKKSACQVCGRRLQVPRPSSAGEPPPAPAWVTALAREPAPRKRPSAGVIAGLAVILVALVATVGGLIALAAPRGERAGKPVADRTTPTDGPPLGTGRLFDPQPTRPASGRTADLPREPARKESAPAETVRRPAGPSLEPPAPGTKPLPAEDLYPRLVRSSVMIATLADSFGSGFVVHVGDRLVVTNYHVVGREDEALVVFPLYDGAGDLITDLSRYKDRIREIAVRGTVVSRDAGRDLALIRVDRVPDRASGVPLAGHPAPTGSVVYSVGGSGADLNLVWRFTKGNVRGRAPRKVLLEYGWLDCTVLETDAPVNRGDSGGPVVNDRGELVGVVAHFGRNERLVSGNIDVEEVRSFVARHLPAR